MVNVLLHICPLGVFYDKWNYSFWTIGLLFQNLAILFLSIKYFLNVEVKSPKYLKFHSEIKQLILFLISFGGALGIEIYDIQHMHQLLMIIHQSKRKYMLLLFSEIGVELAASSNLYII